MPLLLPGDPASLSAAIREQFSKHGGRCQTLILSMPDGTPHIESGMSLMVELSSRFMAALANNSIYGRHQPAQLAQMAIENTKALLRAIKEDAEAESVKATATEKVLAETKGSDV